MQFTILLFSDLWIRGAGSTGAAGAAVSLVLIIRGSRCPREALSVVYCNRKRNERRYALPFSPLNTKLNVIPNQPSLYWLYINASILLVKLFQYGPTLKSLVW